MSEKLGTYPPVAQGPAVEPHRPTRAELRRAAEVAESARTDPPAAPAHTRAAAVTATTRREQRRVAAERARQARSQNAIWKAWWLYPLVAAIGVCVWFGVQSAANQPHQEPSVVTTITAQP
jgi:hypothetical protein